MNNIQKTVNYILELFEDSEFFKDKQLAKQYRLDHTFRVASIGKEIAEKENLDIEATVIGCLLHDISYINKFDNREDRMNHGRKSAEIAKSFVHNLDIAENLKNEILYGIAIHVDDKSDFEGERTVLAETIGEADNIDRFDKYRLYEALADSKLDEMSLEEQIEFATKKMNGTRNLKNYVFKSKTSNDLWNDKLDYQIKYYEELLAQLNRTDYKNLF